MVTSGGSCSQVEALIPASKGTHSTLILMSHSSVGAMVGGVVGEGGGVGGGLAASGVGAGVLG